MFYTFIHTQCWEELEVERSQGPRVTGGFGPRPAGPQEAAWPGMAVTPVSCTQEEVIQPN